MSSSFDLSNKDKQLSKEHPRVVIYQKKRNKQNQEQLSYGAAGFSNFLPKAGDSPLLKNYQNRAESLPRSRSSGRPTDGGAQSRAETLMKEYEEVSRKAKQVRKFHMNDDLIEFAKDETKKEAEVEKKKSYVKKLK